MSGFFKKMFSRITGKNEQEQEKKSEEVTTTVIAEDSFPPLPTKETIAGIAADEATIATDDRAGMPPLVSDPAPVVGKPAPKKNLAKPLPAPKTEKPLSKKSEQKTKTEITGNKPKSSAKGLTPKSPSVISPDPSPDEHQSVAQERPRPDLKHGRLTSDKIPAQLETIEEKPDSSRWLSRLTLGLSKSSKSITTSISSVFTKRKLDTATLQDFEDVLIQADLGVTVSERIVKALAQGRHDKEVAAEDVRMILAKEVEKILQTVEVPFSFGNKKPFVILVVGVNGAGKTTTIGKLGAIARSEGYKVMFAACDTFRAAAIEQLTVWGDRIGARTISRPTGADSSGLAFDAMQAATAEQADILFIDTAGRLQNKTHLMEELEKIVRVIAKQDATAPHAVLLVLDATTGQNALAQAEVFTKVAGVTGIIMTKLDGTARGGILVAIAEKYKIPIHAIGIGEAIEDLQPFDAHAFAQTIAGLETQ